MFCNAWTIADLLLNMNKGEGERDSRGSGVSFVPEENLYINIHFSLRQVSSSAGFLPLYAFFLSPYLSSSVLGDYFSSIYLYFLVGYDLIQVVVSFVAYNIIRWSLPLLNP